MNRSEVVRSVARRTGVSQVETKKLLQAFFDVVSFALSIGEEVTLTNFGTFDTFIRKATAHALNGPPKVAPDTPVVTFRSAEKLKQIVNP